MDDIIREAAQNSLDKFVDSATAADLLNRSRATVCDMANRGALHRFRVGAAVLFWRDEVQRAGEVFRRHDAIMRGRRGDE